MARPVNYIRETKSSNFGLEVDVRRMANGKADMYPSGHPSNDGLTGSESAAAGIGPGNRSFRDPIAPGTIGSSEGYDPQLPPGQYIDTVQWYRNEDKDPSLHGSREALRAADTNNIGFNEYGKYQPRRAPLPRARQDEGYLGPLPSSADPLMTDANSSTLFAPREVGRKDLYGENRDGFPHNDGPAKTMSEFKAGKLNSGSGKKVTNPKQAVAIAMNQAGKGKK